MTHLEIIWQYHYLNALFETIYIETVKYILVEGKKTTYQMMTIAQQSYIRISLYTK